MASSGLLALARKRIGDAYVLGVTVPKDNPGWTGPWDCAEFTSWLVYQVSGRLYGCDDNAASAHFANAYTGHWHRDVLSMGMVVSPEVAAGTEGSFLLRLPASVPGVTGHIVVSDGTGGTVEAMGAAFGVVASTAVGRRWDFGVLIPWLSSAARPPIALGKVSVLRLGDSGPKVRALQKALSSRGFNPGSIDGQFGPHTLAAVTAFQRTRGLVVDGEVGQKTLAALDAH